MKPPSISAIYLPNGADSHNDLSLNRVALLVSEIYVA